MDTIYKLTDQNLTTYNDHQWTIGEWYETSGKGELCGPGFLHCYDNPIKAALFNPIHADFLKPRLFKGEAEGVCKMDGPMKKGYSRMRILEEIPVPVISTEKRVEFAIRCAMGVYRGSEFQARALDWLSGGDRSRETPWATAATIRAAEYAARSLAGATEAATRVTEATAKATEAADWASEAAARAAAWSAVRAAVRAAAKADAAAAFSAAWSADAVEAIRAADAAAFSAAWSVKYAAYAKGSETYSHIDTLIQTMSWEE